MHPAMSIQSDHPAAAVAIIRERVSFGGTSAHDACMKRFNAVVKPTTVMPTVGVLPALELAADEAFAAGNIPKGVRTRCELALEMMQRSDPDSKRRVEAMIMPLLWQAQDLPPSSAAQPLLMVARVYAKLGNFGIADEAAKEAHEYLTIQYADKAHPTMVDAMLLRAELLKRRGKARESEEMVTAASVMESALAQAASAPKEMQSSAAAVAAGGAAAHPSTSLSGSTGAGGGGGAGGGAGITAAGVSAAAVASGGAPLVIQPPKAPQLQQTVSTPTVPRPTPGSVERSVSADSSTRPRSGRRSSRGSATAISSSQRLKLDSLATRVLDIQRQRFVRVGVQPLLC